jgi:hypothetical protein
MSFIDRIIRMKFKLLRDDIGGCICEDCVNFQIKKCKIGKKSADKFNECIDFHRSYEVIGLKLENKFLDFDIDENGICKIPIKYFDLSDFGVYEFGKTM